MNLWITTAKKRLLTLLPRVDILILNDSEARMLTGQPSLVRAGRELREIGTKNVVIKKGEHGALLFSEHGFFAAPSFPIEDVFDPTGAGDTFAGGMIGYLNKIGNKMDWHHLCLGVAYGTIMASLNVEDFSLERLKRATEKDLSLRLNELRRMTAFP
jgi:sugar/nucleoside kinase (ribokinase family)